MILIVHPIDPSTKHLLKLQNRIAQKLPQETHIFNIHPNDESKLSCLEAIKKRDDSDLIVFLGHGSKNGLQGSKGKYYDSLEFASKEAVVDSPESFYYDEFFINENNSNVLKNKQIICMSCFSNEFGKRLFACNIIKHIIGFGLLPTSYDELQDFVKTPNLHLVGLIKGELNWVIEKAIVYGYLYNYSIPKIGEFIQFCFQNRIAYYLHTKIRYRFQVAQILHTIKNEIFIK